MIMEEKDCRREVYKYDMAATCAVNLAIFSFKILSKRFYQNWRISTSVPAATPIWLTASARLAID